MTADQHVSRAVSRFVKTKTTPRLTGASLLFSDRAGYEGELKDGRFKGKKK